MKVRQRPGSQYMSGAYGLDMWSDSRRTAKRYSVVRLHAPLPLIEERIRRREPNPEDELSAARWLEPLMDTCGLADYLVENGRRPLRAVESEVLRLAGWLP